MLGLALTPGVAVAIGARAWAGVAVPPGDTTAPVITNLALTGNDITLNQSEGNKYYWLMNLDATQLVGTALRAAVLAGTPAKFGSNMAVVLGENLQTVSTAGLATGTWQFHIVGEDAAGNVGAFGSVSLP